MTAWTSEELNRVGGVEELDIASQRRDGTMTMPVTIWVARHDGGLYVRSAVKGRDAAWFRATQLTRHGRISAGGATKDVTFEDADHRLDGAIDAAFEAKYRRYGPRYVRPMVTPEARSTTLKLVPR